MYTCFVSHLRPPRKTAAHLVRLRTRMRHSDVVLTSVQSIAYPLYPPFDRHVQCTSIETEYDHTTLAFVFPCTSRFDIIVPAVALSYFM